MKRLRRVDIFTSAAFIHRFGVTARGEDGCEEEKAVLYQRRERERVREREREEEREREREGEREGERKTLMQKSAK